ncbi:MAG: T9SS type A sorting domain-containing protein [Bacteroidetes bacterium]|nr:T9SS type A sorting domain-containing protein [Bacteroidota bacterium]
MLRLFYVTLILTFFGTTLTAQIVLNQSDFPVANQDVKLFHTYKDGDTTTLENHVSIGTGAANETYDFSSVASLINDSSMVYYLHPDSTPWGSYFPGAECAIYEVLTLYDSVTQQDDSVGYAYFFYYSTQDSFSLSGLVGEITIAFFFFSEPYAPAYPQYKTSFTYPSTHHDSSSWSLYDVFFQIHQEQVRDVEIDGYGVLNTPLGGFDVLRAKVKESVKQTRIFLPTDTTIEEVMTYQYLYYAKNLGHPLVTVDMDSNWQKITNITYGDFQPPSAIPELPQTVMVKVYPNPASASITIDLSAYGGELKTLGLYNVIGQKVKEIHHPGNHGKKVILDISDLHPGVYLVLLEDRAGTQYKINKLVISN